MPRKHSPGCGCCAPCGFVCNPCVGSVSVDLGAAGGFTRMFPLTDPCTGIVTRANPHCIIGDYVCFPCDKETHIVCERERIGPVLCTEFLSYGQRFAEWWQLTSTETGFVEIKSWMQGNWSIEFNGLRSFTLQYIVTKFWYVRYSVVTTRRRRFEKVIPGPCTGTAPSLDLVSESFPCNIAEIAYEPCETFGSFLGMGFQNCCGNVRELGCNGNLVGLCPGSDQVGYNSFQPIVGCGSPCNCSQKCKTYSAGAMYREQFTIPDCASFLDTWTLPRTESRGGGIFNIDVNRNWWGSDVFGDCRYRTNSHIWSHLNPRCDNCTLHELDLSNPFPATVTFTIA